MIAMDRLRARLLLQAALDHAQLARAFVAKIGPVAGLPDGAPEASMATDYLAKAERALAQALQRIPDNGDE